MKCQLCAYGIREGATYELHLSGCVVCVVIQIDNWKDNFIYTRKNLSFRWFVSDNWFLYSRTNQLFITRTTNKRQFMSKNKGNIFAIMYIQNWHSLKQIILKTFFEYEEDLVEILKYKMLPFLYKTDATFLNIILHDHVYAEGCITIYSQPLMTSTYIESFA